MALTLGGFIYLVFFLATTLRRIGEAEEVSLPDKNIAVNHLDPGSDLDPEAPPAVPDKSLNIFTSRNSVINSANVQQTPTGQLPAQFKVVGLVVADPAQVIIEDASARQTYFITQDKPQAGISIERVEKDKIIVQYQDQSIAIPVNQHTHATTP